jgi:hypothetical protein
VRADTQSNAFDMANDIEHADQQRLATTSKSLDYHSILVEAIQNTAKNSAQLRSLVYERARFHLKREILFGTSSLGVAELVRQINDLELAIARIEANAVDLPSLPPYQQPAQAPDTTQFSTDNAVEVMPPPSVDSEFVEVTPLTNANYFGSKSADYFGAKQGWDAILKHIQAATRFVGFVLLGFLFIGLVIMASALWYFPKNSTRVETATSVEKPTNKVSEAKPKVGEAAQKTTDRVGESASAIKENAAQANNSDETPVAPVEAAPKLPFPIPTSYGVYVLDHNKLTELQSLRIHVPDPRVALSAEVKKPSTLEISDNKPAFILFRRDLLNNAPQKLSLRVVARMARETKIVNGKASVTPIEGAWRIRNISRELNVAPIAGQREMVIARVDDATPLAAGRYILDLNRTGYDFTIKGPVESLEFCLEGFETKNGSMFNQCRSP